MILAQIMFLLSTKFKLIFGRMVIFIGRKVEFIGRKYYHMFR